MWPVDTGGHASLPEGGVCDELPSPSQRCAADGSLPDPTEAGHTDGVRGGRIITQGGCVLVWVCECVLVGVSVTTFEP